ncbi:MAG: Ppx/GppA family phosphatase [Candidatus Bathyarchaeota archaeon]|nr:Ppx/GppA family phosphatase [Candidatus Bathyarchaeota archaeon]
METALKTKGEVVAFVDIGTNSVRLLVVRVNPNLSYTVISREKEVVRLGENEFEDNALQPQAIERTVFVCKKFAELAGTYGAKKIIAVGTSATREAKNRDEFLQKLVDDVGFTVHVITGLDEARLIYLGVSSSVDIGDQKALFVDLGGGSTEISIGDQRRIFHLSSFKFGAIRLTTQFIGEGWTGPVSEKAYKQIKKRSADELQEVKAKVQEYGVRRAFGTSGTIINLAEIAGKLFKKNDNGKAPSLTRKHLRKLTPILCSKSLEERKNLPGINTERADIIVAGAAIVDAVMDELGIEEIVINNRGLLDGLLVDYLSMFEGFQQLQKSPIRKRSVLTLGRSCNFDEKHSQTVADLALQLFDSAKQIGLHHLGDYERDLLKHATMLHDIGDFLSFNDHHLHSHYIISHADLYGFDRKEKTVLANIARFHRKKLPSKKGLKITGLDDKTKSVVVLLSAFVRFAEKLDRSHCGIVKKVEFSKKGKDHVLLSFYAETDCSLEKWSILQNKQAFYEAFGRELEVRCIVAADTAQTAAT